MSNKYRQRTRTKYASIYVTGRHIKRVVLVKKNFSQIGPPLAFCPFFFLFSHEKKKKLHKVTQRIDSAESTGGKENAHPWKEKGSTNKENVVHQSLNYPTSICLSS